MRGRGGADILRGGGGRMFLLVSFSGDSHTGARNILSFGHSCKRLCAGTAGRGMGECCSDLSGLPVSRALGALLCRKEIPAEL